MSKEFDRHTQLVLMCTETTHEFTEKLPFLSPIEVSDCFKDELLASMKKQVFHQVHELNSPLIYRTMNNGESFHSKLNSCIDIILL